MSDPTVWPFEHITMGALAIVREKVKAGGFVKITMSEIPGELACGGRATFKLRIGTTFVRRFNSRLVSQDLETLPEAWCLTCEICRVAWDAAQEGKIWRVADTLEADAKALRESVKP